MSFLYQRQYNYIVLSANSYQNCSFCNLVCFIVHSCTCLLYCYLNAVVWTPRFVMVLFLKFSSKVFTIFFFRAYRRVKMPRKLSKGITSSLQFSWSLRFVAQLFAANVNQDLCTRNCLCLKAINCPFFGQHPKSIAFFDQPFKSVSGLV